MEQERTELEWPYEPEDFFEVPYSCADIDYELLFQDGRAVATLRLPQESVGPELQKRIWDRVEGVCKVRELQNHRKYELKAKTISHYYPDGRKDLYVHVTSESAAGAVSIFDLVLKDAEGKTISDSRAARIAHEKLMLDILGPKVADSAKLSSLLKSYSRAVRDPANEFVYLYEILEALEAEGQQNVFKFLGIDRKVWLTQRKLLHDITNCREIEQSRHRGRKPTNRRPATHAELTEVRAIAKRWIAAFGSAV